LVNSKQKGKRGELEACKVLNETFGINFRRSQQFKGTKESADLIDDQWPELCPEVKRRKAMNLHKVVEQARREAEGKVPFVVHRKDGESWLLTVDLRDARSLVNLLHFAASGERPIF